MRVVDVTEIFNIFNKSNHTSLQNAMLQLWGFGVFRFGVLFTIFKF